MVWISIRASSLSAIFLMMSLLAMFPTKSDAYPQYSARYAINSCTACHLSPSGGGPRNLNGKLFGAGGFEMNQALAQDYISADFRALYYYPQEASSSKGGMGIMSGSVAGHVYLDSAKWIHLVIEHNIAGFAMAPYRDTYALFKISSSETPSFFDTLIVGRFRVPFGIATDEHRTYVRFQNQTRWFDFETGAMLSGNPTYEWHYDFAIVNGEKSAGQSLNTGQALRWGAVANVRWMPGPFVLGLSGSLHEHENADETHKSVSVYSTLSVGRWTDDRIPLTLQVEHALAWQWNSILTQGFVSDPAYSTAVARSPSQGWLVWLEWELSRHLALIYKYDRLAPDRGFPADFYARHGVGWRWRVGPNALIQGRFELANATHPSESKGEAIGRQSAAFGFLQLGF